MDSEQAFCRFVRHALAPGAGERLAAMATGAKGRRKILLALSHRFRSDIRAEAIRRLGTACALDRPCYVYCEGMPFGAAMATVQGAYENLAECDSWLILLQDGSAAIHRPERWDDEVEIGL
ncbi:MAG: hypothetical protein NT029_02720 [Armatimonadetes bacterium]|nr:hypothetical protein [Armatimonadota bacterium]